MISETRSSNFPLNEDTRGSDGVAPAPWPLRTPVTLDAGAETEGGWGCWDEEEEVEERRGGDLRAGLAKGFAGITSKSQFISMVYMA